MRLRRKKNRDTRFEKCIDLALEPVSELKEDFYDIFNSEKELRIEIGSGKGGFITKNAEQNPKCQFISVERVKDCILMGMEKANNMELENIRFICADAEVLTSVLPEKCADIIYINFCDPWPKDRHAKRRLTHRRMIAHYLPLLKDGGQIHFKTDNDGLFDFSVEELKDIGFELSNVTYDLHSTDTPNIMTEYEKRFSDMGVKIKRLEAKPTAKTYEILKP
jgi:tRNA (guanine-N7-)-methyltransferase